MVALWISVIAPFFWACGPTARRRPSRCWLIRKHTLSVRFPAGWHEVRTACPYREHVFSNKYAWRAFRIITVRGANKEEANGASQLFVHIFTNDGGGDPERGKRRSHVLARAVVRMLSPGYPHNVAQFVKRKALNTSFAAGRPRVIPTDARQQQWRRIDKSKVAVSHQPAHRAGTFSHAISLSCKFPVYSLCCFFLQCKILRCYKTVTYKKIVENLCKKFY